ncbi:PEP-CTERM sorting domain-containing protein [Phycisphaeraceae bacterium D3-23]
MKTYPKFRQTYTLVTACACLTPAGGTHAQVFDNGDPSGGFGTNVLSERDAFNQVGDDFDLASNASIDSVRWWGVGDEQQFEMRIFSNAGTPNNAPLHNIDLGTVAGTPTGFGGGGSDVLEYNADFAAINLAPGDYVISIVEATAGDNWFWSASCEDGCEGESWRRDDDADSWESGNWQFAFVLDGVPEPGTGALAAVGALVLIRRRRSA